MTTDIAVLATEADPRWSAVLARDPAADGRFVFAVRSTGIYCRPSCPARRPKPENVVFYAEAAQAEEAGYRACLRCRPGKGGTQGRDGERVAALCRRIEAAEAMPPLAQLAREAGVSVDRLRRLFRAVTGLTPGDWWRARRAARVRDALGRGTAVSDAIYQAGYSSSGRFYEEADEVLGMKPSDYRAGGAHNEIRFALGDCSLGAILVARGGRGLCAILLGDDPEALLRDLQERFRAARLIGGDAGFESLVAQVVGLVESPGIGHQLPLDLRGTAFQQRVWRALQAIPPGQTLSYRALAERIGLPRGARAVAGACAANPLAVAIPCHRVVRGDGGLSGYRWGVERKRALLEREARCAGAAAEPVAAEQDGAGC